MAQNSRALYERFMQVISKWPIDVNKEGRDVSLRIRSRIGQIFPRGEQTTISPNQLASIQREVESLERIINNTHRNKFDRYSLTEGYSSATGLTLEHLHRATSNTLMENINSMYQMSLLDRIKLKFRFFK